MSERVTAMATPTVQTKPQGRAPQVDHFQGLKSFLGRISPQEWRRRALHILPGFMPLVLWKIFHRDPLSWDARAWLGGIIIGIGVLTAIKYHRVARRGEVANSACILGYTIPVFAMLFLLPAQAELGFATLAIISLGDGSATLGGMLLRGPRLPWNPSKSWAGLLSFMLIGAPYSAMIYWGEARPGVPYVTAFCMTAFATLLAAIAESLPAKLNDNVRVGATAAVSLIIAQSIWVGW